MRIEGLRGEHGPFLQRRAVAQDRLRKPAFLDVEQRHVHVGVATGDPRPVALLLAIQDRGVLDPFDDGRLGEDVLILDDDPAGILEAVAHLHVARRRRFLG